MTSWRSDWYPDAMAKLRESRGGSALGSDGISMPMITGIETIGVLGQFSPRIVSAISTLQAAQGRSSPSTAGDRVPDSGIVDSEQYVSAAGTNLQDFIDSATMPRKTISLANWLAGVAPINAQPWKRTDGSASPDTPAFIDVIAGLPTYAPFVVNGIATQPELMRIVHELAVAWNDAVRYSAALIVSYIASPITANVAVADGFFGAIRRMCSSLDTLQENPPASTKELIIGALDHAKDESAKFAGKAAAEIAAGVGQVAGDVSGNFLDSFLKNASVMSVVVAGLAVYWFVA